MRKKIGELLVHAGVVTEAQVRTALAQKRTYGKGHRLGSVMVSMGMLTPKQLARALAEQFDLPFVELPEIPPSAASLLPVDFQSGHRVIPFKLEGEGKAERVHVAVEDPANLSLIDELRFQLRKPLRLHVASSDDIDQALVNARGEKLEIVQAVALGEEDEVTGEMSIERGSPVQGGWAGEEEEVTPPTPRPRPPVVTPAPATPPPPPKEAATDFIDDLLGTSKKRPAQPPPPPPPPDPEPGKPRVPVLMFGGAAKNVKPPERNLPPDFSEEDLKVLDDLERISHGEEPAAPTQKIMPAQMVAALIRLLIKRGIIQEEEFLTELSQK